jgi:hypothetical protein
MATPVQVTVDNVVADEKREERGSGGAKAIYSRLQSWRFNVLERMRDCAALTLPGLIPPEGNNDTMILPEPYQSVGARGVNNLSSKLLLALMPPGQPFFRLRVSQQARKDLQALGQNKLSDVEQKLAGIETQIGDKVETSHVRPLLAEVIKHLIVGGNALMHIPSHEEMRMFRLDQYVICRDAMGRPLQAVVKETTVVDALDEGTCTVCHVNRDDEFAKVDIYTYIEWDYVNKKVSHWQEINDFAVPQSDGERPLDKSEWIPLRWIAVPNCDYGRSMCEEYLGDLRSLEGLSEAIVQFAQASAKIVALVHPNSTTSMEEFNKAESGDAIVGSKADIDIFQLEKQQDFTVANTVAERLEQRISYAFLLQTGATRDAERVTAEEIRQVAQELEDALGGVYTVLSQEMQLPLVNRLMAIMTESKELPPLPPGSTNPVIVTGFEALGRNHALNKLRSYFQDLSEVFGPQVLAQRVDFNEVAKRFASGYGVEKPEDLWKSDQQVQQDTQQTTMQQGLQKAAPQIAGPLVQHALASAGSPAAQPAAK